MSFTEKGRKVRPPFGKEIPPLSAEMWSGDFAHVIAAALRRDFGDNHAAVKQVASLAHANQRAVKNWYEARNGPNGQHLVDLMRSSDEVLEAVLLMSGRTELLVAKKLADSKRELRKMLMMIHEAQKNRIKLGGADGMSLSDLVKQQEVAMLDPAAVINAAIHSAFVKYPREEDPDWSSQWIRAKDSAHLTNVVMLELEAAGFVIIRNEELTQEVGKPPGC